MIKVGVIGGGQLAWMMAKEAPKLEIELSLQTPSASDSAVNLAHQVIFAPVADATATAKLANQCDVITFENEFVDLEALQELVAEGVCFRPSLSSLNPLLDKYKQRCFLHNLGLAVPQFRAYQSSQDLAQFDFPLVLKARRHGYDGKGTVIVQSKSELEQALKQFKDTPLVVEEFIPFSQELAVMAARGIDGQIKIYPVTQTYQREQVCRWVIAPVDLAETQTEIIQKITTKLLTDLDYIGVLGIELFLTREGMILVNEIAPRTHNSGHYTLDACVTSQFALQLQAVTGKPLGDISLKSKSALMVNLLGGNFSNSDYQEKLAQISKIERAFVHWYGKTELRPGRKLGHVTVLFDSNDTRKIKSIAEKIESIWYN